MSSYFDAMQREVCEAGERIEGDEEFLAAAAEIEGRLFRDVCAITGDREFPDELREKILGAFARRSIWVPEGSPSASERNRERVLGLRCSRVVEDIHDLFHDVARSRTLTRFGFLSDSPRMDAIRRDEYDNPSEEDEA